MAGRLEYYPETLLAAVDRSLRRGLQQFGEDVAADASGSLPRRSRPSAPGEVPSLWTGALGEIGATVDERTNAVSIGPALQPSRHGGGEIPALLEAGGTGPGGTVIEARPYLVPAFQRQLSSQVPGIWREALR